MSLQVSRAHNSEPSIRAPQSTNHLPSDSTAVQPAQSTPLAAEETPPRGPIEVAPRSTYQEAPTTPTELSVEGSTTFLLPQQDSRSTALVIFESRGARRLQAPQQDPATRGSGAPGPSSKDHFTWQQLCSNCTQWNPNAREPTRDNGQSVLMSRRATKFYCRPPSSNGFCKYSSANTERVLHHIRKDHLSYLPFVCGGRCASQAWYVLLCI